MKNLFIFAVYLRNQILKQTNIGEGCDANTEITTETKESVASQSVELEPEKSE